MCVLFIPINFSFDFALALAVEFLIYPNLDGVELNTIQNMCICTIKAFLCAIGVFFTQRDRRLPWIRVWIWRNVILKDCRAGSCSEASSYGVDHETASTPSKPKSEARHCAVVCVICRDEAWEINASVLKVNAFLWPHTVNISGNESEQTLRILG